MGWSEKGSHEVLNSKKLKKSKNEIHQISIFVSYLVDNQMNIRQIFAASYVFKTLEKRGLIFIQNSKMVLFNTAHSYLGYIEAMFSSLEFW